MCRCGLVTQQEGDMIGADGVMKDVEAVHRQKGIVLFDDGTTMKVADWYDDSGDICGPDDATFAVCGNIRSGFWTIDLSKFERMKKQ